MWTVGREMTTLARLVGSSLSAGLELVILLFEGLNLLVCDEYSPATWGSCLADDHNTVNWLVRPVPRSLTVHES